MSKNKVKTHLVAMSGVDTYNSVVGNYTINDTVTKEQFIELSSKTNVSVHEFDVTSKRMNKILTKSLSEYKNIYPNGTVVYAIILESGQLIIKPTLYYSPTLGVDFGK